MSLALPAPPRAHLKAKAPSRAAHQRHLPAAFWPPRPNGPVPIFSRLLFHRLSPQLCARRSVLAAFGSQLCHLLCSLALQAAQAGAEPFKAQRAPLRLPPAAIVLDATRCMRRRGAWSDAAPEPTLCLGPCRDCSRRCLAATGARNWP